jgi:hypothetical protein
MVTADYCQRIICGAVSQREAGYDDLLECSRLGYVGAQPCNAPECAPYLDEIIATQGGACGAYPGGEVATPAAPVDVGAAAAAEEYQGIAPIPVMITDIPAIYRAPKPLTTASVMPVMPTIISRPPTHIEGSYPGGIPTTWCGFNWWVGQNPWLAAGAALLGFALLGGFRK